MCLVWAVQGTDEKPVIILLRTLGELEAEVMGLPGDDTPLLGCLRNETRF